MGNWVLETLERLNFRVFDDPVDAGMIVFECLQPKCDYRMVRDPETTLGMPAEIALHAQEHRQEALPKA